MSIPSISQASHTATQLTEHKCCGATTKKTHALVVLGYLLVSIGIALVTASAYLAIALHHPLLALVCPVGPIALGSILLNRSCDESLFDTTPFRASPPLFEGIINKGGNDCWINSAMQLFLHTPAFAKRIQLVSHGFRLFSHPLDPLFKAFNAYQKGEEIDSQALRKWLDAQKITTTSDDSAQDDPMAFVDFFLKKIEHQLPILYEKRVYAKDGEIESTSASQTSADNPLYFFNLGMYIDPKQPTLEGAFESFFMNVETSPTGMTQTVFNFFKRPPEDFIISLDQAAELAQKIVRECAIPSTLKLQGSQVGAKADYECDGFVYHSGRTASSGHWMAVIKKEGKWWHASDHIVKEISQRNARKKMRVASILHFSKK